MPLQPGARGRLARNLPYVERDDPLRQAEEAYRTQPNNFTLSPPHPFAIAVPLYGCPADSRSREPGMARNTLPAAFTSYLGVSGVRTIRPSGVLFRNSAIRYAEILDGTSNTLMVGERP